MDKNLVEEVYQRANYCCERCGRNDLLEIHHIIYGRGKRKQHENIDTIILLCFECHRGTNGVHGKNGAEVDRRLKLQLMDKLQDQGKTEEEIRAAFGGKLPQTDQDKKEWEEIMKKANERGSRI